MGAELPVRVTVPVCDSLAVMGKALRRRIPRYCKASGEDGRATHCFKLTTNGPDQVLDEWV